MNQDKNGMESFFEWEAKTVNDERFWTSTLIQFCQERHIQPRSLTEQKLSEMWVANNKMVFILPIVAKKILEYYWLQWWEMQNPSRIKQVNMTSDHYDFIIRHLNIDGCISKFKRMNYWDKVDADGEATQFSQIDTFDPKTATQIVCTADQKVVDDILNNWFTKDIKRMEKELETCTNDERKEELQNSINILTAKIKELNVWN